MEVFDGVFVGIYNGVAFLRHSSAYKIHQQAGMPFAMLLMVTSVY